VNCRKRTRVDSTGKTLREHGIRPAEMSLILQRSNADAAVALMDGVRE
jgi:hypothetical protein